MALTHIAGILSAAGHLCWAADDLRAAGLLRFADEIDTLLKILDAELSVSDPTTPGPALD